MTKPSSWALNTEWAIVARASYQWRSASFAGIENRTVQVAPATRLAEMTTPMPSAVMFSVGLRTCDSPEQAEPHPAATFSQTRDAESDRFRSRLGPVGQNGRFCPTNARRTARILRSMAAARDLSAPQMHLSRHRTICRSASATARSCAPGVGRRPRPCSYQTSGKLGTVRLLLP